MKKNQVNIESVPLHKKLGKLARSKYRFIEMQPGQSFLVPEGKRHSVATLSKRFGDEQVPKWEFATKMFEDGLRCVRTK